MQKYSDKRSDFKKINQADIQLPDPGKLFVKITERVDEKPFDDYCCDKIETKNEHLYLNYCDHDHMLAKPVKDFLECNNIAYFESGRSVFDGEETIINIVSEGFTECKCMENLDMAIGVGSRIINIIFDGNNIDPIFKKYECLQVKKAEIDDYMLSSIFSNFKNISPLPVKSMFRRLLAMLSNSISINCNEKTAVVCCGSFGYTLINTIRKSLNTSILTFEDGLPPIYLLSKNEQANIGQPPLFYVSKNISVENICLDFTDSPISSEELKGRVAQFITKIHNQNCDRILLVGALGKTTSSLAMPLLAMEAKRQGMKADSICIMPIISSSPRAKKLATSAYDVIKLYSSSSYMYDPARCELAQVNLPLNEYYNYMSVAVLKVMKEILENNDETNMKKENLFTLTLE